MQQSGKLIILAGIILILTGVFLFYSGNRLNWPGHLPGDIRIERPRFRLYIPITTMLLLSIILSLLGWVINRFIK